jgi:hypothetical protein
LAKFSRRWPARTTSPTSKSSKAGRVRRWGRTSPHAEANLLPGPVFWPQADVAIRVSTFMIIPKRVASSFGGFSIEPATWKYATSGFNPTREQLAGGSSAGLVLAIHKGECLPVVVADDEARRGLFRRSRAAGSGARGWPVHRGIKLMSRRHFVALAASRRSITREKSSGMRSIAASSANKCSNSNHTGKPD